MSRGNPHSSEGEWWSTCIQNQRQRQSQRRRLKSRRAVQSQRQKRQSRFAGSAFPGDGKCERTAKSGCPTKSSWPLQGPKLRRLFRAEGVHYVYAGGAGCGKHGGTSCGGERAGGSAP